MKNVFLAGFLFLGMLSYAQSGGSGFGIKAGLNYSNTGKLEIEDLANIDPDGNVGYHVGVWGRLGKTAYLRPELIYTQTSSDYDGQNFKMQKIDLPVLFGHRFLNIFHGFVGPAFQFVLDTDLKDIELSDVENNTTVGFQIGGGVNLGKLGIDLRYEGAFGSNFVTIIGEDQAARLDTRPSQLILALSFMF